jgi:CTD kinase subunit alpha
LDRSRSRSPPPFDSSYDTGRPEFPSRDPDPVPSRFDEEPKSDHERRLPARQSSARSPPSHNRRRRRQDSTGRHSSTRSEIDDDMASHSSYRGGYAPAHSHGHQYSDDPRGFSQSPQHTASYHDSPSQSPYGGGRNGWGNRFSPQQFVPPDVCSLMTPC